MIKIYFGRGKGSTMMSLHSKMWNLVEQNHETLYNQQSGIIFLKSQKSNMIKQIFEQSCKTQKSSFKSISKVYS